MKNRIIKFRVWDKDYFNFLGRDGGCFASPHYIYSLGDIINGKFDSLVIQQFTGLLDKNGKEIYEGDILHYFDDSDDSRGKVVFEDYQWIIKWQWGGYTKSFGVWENSDEITVIGNIFENSDLIK